MAKQFNSPLGVQHRVSSGDVCDSYLAEKTHASSAELAFKRGCLARRLVSRARLSCRRIQVCADRCRRDRTDQCYPRAAPEAHHASSHYTHRGRVLVGGECSHADARIGTTHSRISRGGISLGVSWRDRAIVGECDSTQTGQRSNRLSCWQLPMAHGALRGLVPIAHVADLDRVLSETRVRAAKHTRKPGAVGLGLDQQWQSALDAVRKRAPYESRRARRALLPIRLRRDCLSRRVTGPRYQGWPD